MTLRLCFLLALSLGMSGCVAAIPLASQAVSSGAAANQLCAVAKMTGQTPSLCDRTHVTASAQPAGSQATAAR